MGVFDATRGQVLARPVSNYYKGEAIRQQLAAGELSNESARFELNAAPERMQMQRDQASIQKEELQLRRDQGRLSREKFESDVGKEEAQEFAKRGFEITYAIDTAVTNGEIDRPTALERAAEKFTEYAQSLPEEYGAGIREKLRSGLTIDEYREIKARFVGAMDEYGLLDEQKQNSVTPTELQKELGPLVERDVITQEAADAITLARTKKTAYGESKGAIDSSDSSLLMRAAHSSFGGLFGPSGELMPLEKGLAGDMLNVSADAERIFIAGNGEVGHQTAVKIARDLFDSNGFDIEAAAKELGVNAEDLEHTADKHGISVEEAYQRLKSR